MRNVVGCRTSLDVLHDRELHSPLFNLLTTLWNFSTSRLMSNTVDIFNSQTEADNKLNFPRNTLSIHKRLLRSISTSRLRCNTPYPTLFTKKRLDDPEEPANAVLRTSGSEDSLRKLTAAMSLFRRRQAPSTRRGIGSNTEKRDLNDLATDKNPSAIR